MTAADATAARPAGEAAARAWIELGCPYEAALAVLVTGDEALLRHSHAELQRLGAHTSAAHVVRIMRERGVRDVHSGRLASTRENPAGLTGRELDVMALLAEGLRNAQIADRLVVSRKTVDHHVSSILGKLGVSTRTEAAAEAARLGIVSGWGGFGGALRRRLGSGLCQRVGCGVR